MIGAALLAMMLATSPVHKPLDAKALFARMKTLAGEWSGVEQDGRKEKVVLSVIANGSVLMERSWFEAHPGEEMVTMYHLDGEKLVLTHYCVAKNQPRLQAASLSEDGNEITFEFRDGTNMKSRDTGHMDKVRFRFVDENHFSSQWTWYVKGKESWMEKFTYEKEKTTEKVPVATDSLRSKRLDLS